MRVYLESLGCRLNAAEIEALARGFAGGGHTVVDDPSGADVIVLNSCAVTAQAARRTRHRLRALHRSGPAADIAVTGCWATEDLDRAARFPGVRWVVPNVDKTAAVAEITGHETAPAPWSPGRWGHTRAFLGVQDGCDHACTYCVTRILRGPARSRPIGASLAAVKSLVAGGAQEVVLTGVSLGSYGQDLGLEHGLAHLVSAILDETDLARLRLSSVEPWDVDDELFQCWSSSRLCRQLHLPLQSGSNAVLKRMGRPIRVETFRALVSAVREIVPEIAITTDLIAGFPGETEEDFAQTLAFVEEIGFPRLHVFPYSERAGTSALRLEGRVPQPLRKARARKLRGLGRRLAADYRARFIGEVLPVLWERADDEGVWMGWTDNYLSVRAASDHDLYN
ncbi:MAG: tRNA (N(6)-L-threonylcarbamoyladenosine(37)-C(2))-methylthiotransferase MtaB, partial [Anaerolineae bacterium]